MKREAIEKLLKDNGIAEDKIKAAVDIVMDENGKDIEAEKSKTTAKDGELEKANETIRGLQETVGKYDGKDPEKLEKDLKELEVKYNDEIKVERAKAENVQKEYGLREALKGANVLDPDYLIFKHGGVEKFAFSDGKPVGIDDIVKPYKESSPHLFAPEGDGKQSTVTINSAGEHKPGKTDTTPETLRGALADVYK